LALSRHEIDYGTVRRYIYMEKQSEYDLVIVGAGVSGAAQLYAAVKYSNIKRILLVEKESGAGLINSSATQNSQTLHEGDIETNYNLEKATAVKHKSGFTRQYLQRMKSHLLGDLYLPGPKMVLAVGEEEIDFLEERHTQFRALFPGLQKLDGSELSHIEPKLSEGRSEIEKIIALYNKDGITVNFGRLASELIADALEYSARQPERVVAVQYDTSVDEIVKTDSGWSVGLGTEVITTSYLSICAGSHSMYFAKKIGLKAVSKTSLLLVAGNFYYTPKYLNTKVYTVQNPKLPFSAVHGDPDILNPETKTRYGPTTRIVVTLERGRMKTFLEYLTTISPFFGSLGAYLRIMLDREFFFYAFKHNVLFLIPGWGNYLFVKEIRKIIPSLAYKDLERARGQGGVRPQIVRTTETNPLNLGEAKLAGEHISFNVTPSPGATTCVYNGLIDVQRITKDIGYSFDTNAVALDFGQVLDVL